MDNSHHFQHSQLRINNLNTDHFSVLELHTELLDNLKQLQYRQMTPIQAQALPLILDGKDLIAQSKTGSGKTAAFALGLLQKLQVSQFCIQSLVLCPTRELAEQVAQEIRTLGRMIPNIKVLALCGGTPLLPQAESLKHGAHIIVGTPGRIDDHLRRGNLPLAEVRTLVLDEADRMLDMGFQSELDNIFAQMPAQYQTLLFSATYSEEVKAIAQHITQQPEQLVIADSHTQSSIRQHLYQVADEEERIQAVSLLLLHYRPSSTVVFCNTKRETQALAEALYQQGFYTLALHGDLEQRDRDQTLLRFANKSISVLVATDVAARGLDIDNLDMVINYHIAGDKEVHVHRVGRTGRAGNSGLACTLYTEAEAYKVVRLEEYLGQSLQTERLPPSRLLNKRPEQPEMVTLLIHAGKKQKLRPGDILGALTAEGEEKLEGKDVGKINVQETRAYVAVQRQAHRIALRKLEQGTLKGRRFRVRKL